MAHRNSYKTTSCVIVGTIWYLLFFDPNCRILLSRKTYEGALSAAVEIKTHLAGELCTAIGKYLYGVDSLKGKRWADNLFELSIKTKPTKEGTIRAAGVTTSLTGDHYDLLISDDIITLDDRISRAERDKTKRFIQERNNLKDPVNGRTIDTGTPWHPDDGWAMIPPPAKFPISATNIKGLTTDKLRAIRQGLGASLWAANYELVHISDEQRIFNDPQYSAWPTDANPVAVLDPAYSGTHTTAITLLWRKEDKFFARGQVWEKSIVDLYADIAALLKKYNAGTMWIETNADKGLSYEAIRKLWPVCQPYQEKENKHIKILNYILPRWGKLYFADDCPRDYMSQIVDYQEGGDLIDAPDTLAAALRVVAGGLESQIRKPAVSIWR